MLNWVTIPQNYDFFFFNRPTITQLNLPTILSVMSRQGKCINKTKQVKKLGGNDMALPPPPPPPWHRPGLSTLYILTITTTILIHMWHLYYGRTKGLLIKCVSVFNTGKIRTWRVMSQYCACLSCRYVAPYSMVVAAWWVHYNITHLCAHTLYIHVTSTVIRRIFFWYRHLPEVVYVVPSMSLLSLSVVFLNRTFDRCSYHYQYQ